MSLFFGARLKVKIGANSSRLLLSSNVRAYQTLSPPTTLEPGNNGKKNALVAPTLNGQWKTKNAIQPAPTIPFSSFSVISKLPYSPSYQNSSNLAAQTTRSMAGSAPESHRDGKPTLEYALKLPKTFASMSNEQVLQFAELKIPEACRECIVRDVMQVDQLEYDEAMKVFIEIAKTNREGMPIFALPFYVGFGAAFTGAWVSIPMVFHKSSVEWFNEMFVTSDLPDARDFETVLEVGAASWGWMEPVLGQVSFFLLCMQFSRSQLQNLGIRPYFNWQQERRAQRLIRTYPQYDAEFLFNYSACDRLVRPHEMNE